MALDVDLQHEVTRWPPWRTKAAEEDAVAGERPGWHRDMSVTEPDGTTADRHSKRYLEVIPQVSAVRRRATRRAELVVIKTSECRIAQGFVGAVEEEEGLGVATTIWVHDLGAGEICAPDRPW